MPVMRLLEPETNRGQRKIQHMIKNKKIFRFKIWLFAVTRRFLCFDKVTIRTICDLKLFFSRISRIYVTLSHAHVLAQRLRLETYLKCSYNRGVFEIPYTRYKIHVLPSPVSLFIWKLGRSYQRWEIGASFSTLPIIFIVILARSCANLLPGRRDSVPDGRDWRGSGNAPNVVIQRSKENCYLNAAVNEFNLTTTKENWI